MLKKTIIVVGVSALVCGLFTVSASAKHRHYRHHPMHMVAAKAEPMKAMPGNNPFPIVANSETDRSRHPVPSGLSGNNPMVIKK